MIFFSFLVGISVMVSLSPKPLLADKIPKYFECLLRSHIYENEYIFTPSRSMNESTESSHLIYLYNLEKVDLNDITWKFIQLDDALNNTFFLKSQKYNEYLCTNENNKIFTTQKANKLMINNDLDECKWKFERITTEFNLNTFNIHNVFYKQFLHVEIPSDYSIDNEIHKRKLFMSQRNIIQDNSRWIVDCFDDDFLHLILSY
jgi:hypothetical protein